MRGALIALLVFVALAGCRIAGPGAEASAESAIAETILPPAAAEGAAAPAPEAAAPEPAPEPTAEPIAEPAPGPDMLADQRRLCERAGGQLAPRGRGIYACVRQTRDAGRACAAARDCEGLCLARSGTCAPLAPLFGCQEVFTLPGRRETLCTE